MKIKLTRVALLATAIVLASCSKEDNGTGNGNGGERSVFMKIEQGVTDTRAIENPVGTLPTVDFNNGYLYLTDAAGKIMHRFLIDPTGPTDVNNDPAGTTIKRSDLTGGLEIKKIDATVKIAYLVGNHNLITDYPAGAIVGSNINQVTGHALTYDNSQATITGTNLINATLYGKGDLVKRPLGTAEQYDVTIALKPHIARIEIYDITGEDGTNPVTDFQEFHIKGVFINNYYEGVTGANAPGSVKNWGAGSAEKYGDGVGYPAHMYEWSAANFNNAAITDMVKYADGTDATSKAKVWAFNVFAPEGGTEFPHIILSVSNVKTDPGKAWEEPSFVTVRSFKYDGLGAGTDGAPAVLEAGKIYRLRPGYFKFNPGNLYGTAELSSIDLMVNVTRLTWSEQGIKPEVD